MSKHTPWPWKLDRLADDSEQIDIYVNAEFGRHVIVGSVGGRVHKDKDGFYADYSEIEANARLIAAAPDLLDALAALMDMRDKCFIPNDGNWWDDQAKAAIAKARGDA